MNNEAHLSIFNHRNVLFCIGPQSSDKNKDLSLPQIFCDAEWGSVFLFIGIDVRPLSLVVR
jgi:hypothetical protein